MDLKSSVKNVTNSSPTTRGHVFVYIFMVVWNEPFLEIGVSGGQPDSATCKPLV